MPAKWRDPMPEELETPTFKAIWEIIKTWDINVPAVDGDSYTGATGNHVVAIMDSLMKSVSERPEQTAGILSPSEALYGFTGWLTASDKVLLAGLDDCAWWAEKVAEFCKVNDLPEPREGWATNLIHPSGEVAVAGREKNAD